MGDRFLTDMADVLRAAGCEVVEHLGWEKRARSSGGYEPGRPWAIFWHHTASRPGTSSASNVAYIITGSPVAPVANLYLHTDGVYHVCAAGATNTNGKGNAMPVSKGTIPSDQANTYAVSIEAGNDGVGEPWREEMIDAYFRGSNALAAAYGLKPSDIVSHSAYTSRKIDPATARAVIGAWSPRSINTAGSWSLDDMRAEATRRASAPTPPPTGDDVQVRLLILTDSDAQFLAMTDDEGQALYVTWAGPGGEGSAADKAVTAHRAEAKRKRHKFEQEGDLAGLFNCVRVGPLPYGDSKHTWDGSETWSSAP